MEKVCRWCKHYRYGKCYRGSFRVVEMGSVYAVADSGQLSEVIEETLHSIKPKEFLQEAEELLTEWKISKKRIEELKRLWSEMIPEFLDFELKQALDEQVSVLYQRELDLSELQLDEIEILEPETFYCKEWE